MERHQKSSSVPEGLKSSNDYVGFFFRTCLHETMHGFRHDGGFFFGCQLHFFSEIGQLLATLSFMVNHVVLEVRRLVFAPDQFEERSVNSSPSRSRQGLGVNPLLGLPFIVARGNIYRRLPEKQKTSISRKHTSTFLPNKKYNHVLPNNTIIIHAKHEARMDQFLPHKTNICQQFEARPLSTHC